MAAEKADLPQDTDSLPPNYASSDVYTDSAPPAYRKTNTVRLQITRVVCFTVLAAGLLTGIFILAHTWISTRNACDHGVAPNFPGQSASLIQASVLPTSAEEPLVMEVEPSIQELDSNNMEDSSQLEQESRLMDIPLPSDEGSEESNEERLEMAQEAMEEEAEGLQDIVEEVNDKVKLPVDLILGNPALAGKDVQCKVEKKMQNLGGGILSKTIIVTCDDEDDEPKITNPLEALLGSRPPSGGIRPPMSLLAPILRMMAARASARLQRQLQPKPAMRRFPQPMMQPVAISMSGPMPQPFPGPFPGSFEAPGPFSSPAMNSLPMHGAMHHGGPMPAIFGGQLPVPGNSFIQPNMGPMQFPHQEPNHHHHHHHHSHDEPHMPMNNNENVHFRGFNNMPFRGHENMPFQGNDNMPFRGHENMPFQGNDNMPFRGNENMPFEDNMHNGVEEERMNMPFPANNFNEEEERPEIQFIRGPEPLFRSIPPQDIKPEVVPEVQNRPPIKIIHGFPPQIPDAIKQIVSHIMKNSNKNEDQDNMPVIAIKAMPENRSLQPNQGPPKSKLLLPFPFRAMKLQTRGGRKLENPEEPNVSFNRAPFPLPRGAISSGMRPLVVPEAAGRALDSPVTIPSLPPMRFFPGRLLRLPIPLPEGRAITHMEMKQNPNIVKINDEETRQTEDEHQSLNERDETSDTNAPDFGPPRLHTVIRGPLPMQENTPEDENPLPPFLQKFPPPPPPKFSREGRSGIIREINPEAELVNPLETRDHHMIMVN